MDHRSSTKRPFLKPAALGWVVLCPSLLAGCQSGAQQDLIARELRLQEDQLYAMEDYLTQYQQLVCKYRSENAALRRRLADDYYDEDDKEDELPAPRLRPRDRQPARPGTSIEIRETPGLDGEQPPAREIEIELPDVPPLEGSTSDESPSEPVVNASHTELASEAADGEAPSAAWQETVDNRTLESQNGNEPPPIEASPTSEQPPQIWLRGQVVENEAGGGPRLSVHVDLLDDRGSATELHGTLSLMLLAPDGEGGQQSLARWDFETEELRSAIDSTTGERTMRFYLELPADTPLMEATELWVRALPRDGKKLLAHTRVDLEQPGDFSSPIDLPLPADMQGEPPILAPHTEHAPIVPARIAASVMEGEWTIARPGEPANLPAEEDPSGEWRASSEPIPTVVRASPTAAPRSRAVRLTAHTESVAALQLPPVYKPPTWSPDRSAPAAADKDDRRSAAISRRPAWSATR